MRGGILVGGGMELTIFRLVVVCSTMRLLRKWDDEEFLMVQVVHWMRRPYVMTFTTTGANR